MKRQHSPVILHFRNTQYYYQQSHRSTPAHMQKANHPPRRIFGEHEGSPNSQSLAYGEGQHLQINKKHISAGTESTGQTTNHTKNDPHPDHTYLNFQIQPAPPDQPTRPARPQTENHPQNHDYGVNRQTHFNYERDSFSINILEGTNKLERPKQPADTKAWRKHSENQDQYADASKNRGSEYQQGFMMKRRKIGFSEVKLDFPHNSNEEQEQNQLEMQDIFKAPQMEAGQVSMSFNFALPPPSEDKPHLEQIKASSRSNQGQNMFALERILEASNLYKNYLSKESGLKNSSLNLLEVALGHVEKLPKEFFYKPERIVFQKPKDDLASDYAFNGYHMICKIADDRSRFYYQDLKLSQLYSMKDMKSSEILLDKQLQVSRNVEYDYFNKRFYLFSNAQQKILVYSESTQEKLCEVKVQKKVNDPHLYIHQVNNRIFLLIVGGYCRIEKDIVQGSKFIEIFELMRWEIQLKSKIINLITGRISPIMLKIADNQQTRILILGGCTIARTTRSGRLDYDYEVDMNESTNLTGLSISSHQILELFDIKEQAICHNHSVKIQNPLSLHDGCVVAIKGMFFVLLPGSTHLMQVKVSNKEVNIIDGTQCAYLKLRDELQQREFCIRASNELVVFYTINEEGLLQVLGPEQQAQSRCICAIY